MPVLYRGECRRSLTSIKSEQGTMVITEKALFWWKSHRTKTVWSGKKEEDPPPDLTVSVDQIVSCRETSLHGERLLLLSLRDGTQPHFLSETFPQLMTALQMALEYDRRAKTAEEEKRRGPFVSVPGKGVQPGKNPNPCPVPETAEKMILPDPSVLIPPAAAAQKAMCPYCGHKVVPGYRYCLACGGKL